MKHSTIGPDLSLLPGWPELLITTPSAQPEQSFDASTSLSRRQIPFIMSALLLGVFLAALDQNVVSVATVRIANGLHGFDQQAWAATAYLVTATISTPLYGKLADIYGRKPFYLTAISIFIVGSLACTFATSMYELAGFRAVQGLGAGGLISLAFTIIVEIIPARERARYQGYVMMVFGVATVLGPALGGWFAGFTKLGGIDGWRWVFLVNVPIGVLVLAVAARVLNIPHKRQNHRLDWFGAITLAICPVPLLIVAGQGRDWGWDSRMALVCYAIGIIGLLLFIFAEYIMRDAALIPLRLFKSSTFSVTILSGFAIGAVMFGCISTVLIYLQVMRALSPTDAGLLMLPIFFCIMIGAQIAGRITQRTGRYKSVLVLGTVIVASSTVLYAQVQFDSPLWQPLLFGAILGLGLGCCTQATIISAQVAVGPADIGVSTASATFFRQIGAVLGVAGFLAILFNPLPRLAELPEEMSVPTLTGFTNSLHEVFYAATGVALLATLAALFIQETPLTISATRDSAPAIPVEEDIGPISGHRRKIVDRVLSEPAIDAAVIPEIMARHGSALIQLRTPDRHTRIPAFQFDDTRQPHRIVIQINERVNATRNPLAAADWWLGTHALLNTSPASLLGNGQDDHIWRALLDQIDPRY
ncbi:MDR family MFS transporter [Nocardia sp. CA-135398]|uniref:MDR family MFS transporter n=1 Tax=Nocardia sp. CA-135398 TaxID=3239977 RepID=UPI003D982E0B